MVDLKSDHNTQNRFVVSRSLGLIMQAALFKLVQELFLP